MVEPRETDSALERISKQLQFRPIKVSPAHWRFLKVVSTTTSNLERLLKGMNRALSVGL